jgi:hypothetical protein
VWNSFLAAGFWCAFAVAVIWLKKVQKRMMAESAAEQDISDPKADRSASDTPQAQ